MHTNESTAAADHERYMRRCIELARVAKSQGNTPVGSLVVIDGAIVGEGIETLPAGSSVTGHAEVLACQSAVDQIGSRILRDATLYTTAEPCFMCSYVIRQCECAVVVYGVDVAAVGGVTSCLPVLTDATLQGWKNAPRVIDGVLADECRAI